MEMEHLIDEFKGVGCLFWTRDDDGEVWVLLGRHRPGHIFLDKISYSIPYNAYGGREESSLDAALRVGYEETGIVNDKAQTQVFWASRAGNIEMYAFASRLSKKVDVRHTDNYTAFEWFNLDGQIPDLDYLSSVQLDVFRTFVDKDSGAKVS